jgi:formylglycine-generating enzyme required for sulfatase activity
MKRLGFEGTAMYEDSDKWEATAPVGSFPGGASPFGALDMAGNVAEWTDDLYRSYTGTASSYQDGPHRVVRGGAWSQGAASLVRGASRDNNNPAGRPVNVGFRCARGE